MSFSATFDYEEEREYTDLTLIVEDNGIINKRRSVPTPITVRINNLDDEPTIFDQAVYSELASNNVQFVRNTIHKLYRLHSQGRCCYK